MNQEIKAQWLADLRSGEYAQGTEYLTRNGKDCCWGVLCRQAVRAEVIETRIETREDDDTIVHYDNREDLPSREVYWWAELDPNLEVTLTGTGDVTLSELNDGEGRADRKYSFAEIADIIEEQL